MKSTMKALGLGLAVAIGISASLPALAATTLRLGTVLAPDDPMGQGLDKFKAKVEEATDGEVLPSRRRPFLTSSRSCFSSPC